ncbi:uncharacterized protein LOC124437319 [Xenia sp. Carnegie-2017]|uniref:uncharacterized protein LOC124437319 n=1 Tax=Xenia sp. Carnegie-2017 TaxID=2897299 RepID=UPI001F037B3B|nr:uncharacterized protein LOC124437319 [Xenia sp. Carnegie-2017]
MGLAYAILLFLTKKLKSHSFDVDVFTKSFNSILESLLAHKSGKKVIVYLFDMMLEYLSKEFLHFTKKPQQNMVEEFFYKLTSVILVRSPGVLCIFNEELDPSAEVLRLRTSFFGKTIKWLMPVVFFKIVTKLDSCSLYKESATNEFTHTILLMYLSCVDLYKNWSEPETEAPLTLETFMTFSRYTKDFLLFSESTVLQKVDKGILMRLPNDIKRYFPEL